MPILSVQHTTTYHYRRDVSFGEHRMMFRPRDSHDQVLLDAAIEISPAPVDLRSMLDVFGNSVAFARFDRRDNRLTVRNRITVSHCPVDAATLPAMLSAGYTADERIDLENLLVRRAPDADGSIAEWAERFRDPAARHEDGPYRMMAAMTLGMHDELRYRARREPGVQDPHETLDRRSGSCRDYAVLMMEGARALGLAARFVSGYIFVPDLGGRETVGGGSTHAWVQVFLPGAGWFDFDPTNGIVGSRDLVRVAVTREARQAVPLAGTFFGEPSCCTGMEVTVQVDQSPDAPDRAPDPTRAAPMDLSS